MHTEISITFGHNGFWVRQLDQDGDCDTSRSIVFTDEAEFHEWFGNLYQMHIDARVHDRPATDEETAAIDADLPDTKP